MKEEALAVLEANLLGLGTSISWLRRSYEKCRPIGIKERGSLIDVVNRAEKRGIVPSADRIRELKELRNDIVHEYETDDLRVLFRSALEWTPEIFTLADRTERYCERFQR